MLKMSATLSLQIEHEAEGDAELFVQVRHAGFSGESSAWFTAADLENFAMQLESTYPLRAERPLILQGGVWNKQATTLEQMHVRLKFFPADGRGTVGVEVQLSSEIEIRRGRESQFTVAVEFITEYESLRQFGNALKQMALRLNSGSADLVAF